MLTAALWMALGITALVHVSTLRLSVRALGKGADNAWDNAFGYLLVTLLLSWPIRWIWASHSWVLIALIPPLCAVILTVALRLIYEVGTWRAIGIGLLHLVLTGLLLGTLTLIAGVIAAYIMYGRIISDPLMLIRIILRLIGIEPPF